MRDTTIERKITIFISSHIDERYKMVRKALKTLLLETGMVAYVYVFETAGACSQDVRSAYLREVSLSDLCVFLIDNDYGVSDGVFAEHERAIRDGIRRLYFFCDEGKKDPTPLQNELMNTGEAKYCDKIHEFSDFPEKAYAYVLQDIIDLYRGDRIEASDADEKSDLDVIPVNSFVLRRDIYKRYSAESRLVKLFNPYDIEALKGLSDTNTSYDELSAAFLSMVIGRNAFDHDIFVRLKEMILLTYDEELKRIIELRLNAIAHYYNNNLDDCYKSIQVAYEAAKKAPSVPTWLLNDIVVDMRNVSNTIDSINNRFSTNSDAQKILEESPEPVYFPLIDRFDSSNYSALLKGYFEMHTRSPYSQRFENLNYAFAHIASFFNVAVRLGSLTHIIQTPTRCAEVLIAKFIDSTDFKVFLELIRILLITPDEKRLGKIVSTYTKNVSDVTAAEIQLLINSIKTIPLEYDRNISLCLLMKHFGYYFSDEQYEIQSEEFFRYAHNWCIDSTRNISIGFNILQVVKANLKRMSNQRAVELLHSFFENHLRRFYDEVLRLLSRLDYKQVTEAEKVKTMEYCITLMREKNYTDGWALQSAVIAIRKNIDHNTDLLDDAVRKYMSEFYSKEYDLEINRSNIVKHIEEYIDDIYRRNQEAQAWRYIGYAYNPCDVIGWIMSHTDIDLHENDVTNIMTAIEETLLNPVQQADQKSSAIRLAIYLYFSFPKLSLWTSFTNTINEKSADVLSATFGSIWGNGSQNSLRLDFLLMRIGFGDCSFNNAALGFAAVMSYNESDFISAVRSVNTFLSDVDIMALDDNILGIITNFVLSIGKDKHKDAQFYAIRSLILLSKSSVFAIVVLERLAYLMDDAISDIRYSILNGIRDLEREDKGIRDYILQKGRTDNHYLVRKLAEEITASSRH